MLPSLVHSFEETSRAMSFLGQSRCSVYMNDHAKFCGFDARRGDVDSRDALGSGDRRQYGG